MKQLSPELRVWAMMQLKSDHYRGPFLGAIIEPGALCDLRCPFCPTGNGDLVLSKEFLTKERFKLMLDRLGSSLRGVTLFNWGESLLNPDICDMIAEASDRGLSTDLSANFSSPLFTPEKADRLVRAGLTHLAVSCDGASRRSYRQYRVGGSFDSVMSNIETLQQAKIRLSADNPKIEWHFMIHKGNQHELKSAAELAGKLGVPIRFKRLNIPAGDLEKWSPHPDARPSSSTPSRICLQTWDCPVIHSDGTVLPCCVVNNPEYGLGNIFQERLEKIWNKPLIVAMRRYLKSGRKTPRKLPCYNCLHNPHKPGS